MIHQYMTSHPVAEFLLCFGANHQDGRPMLFGFLCILNAENVEKVFSRPFKSSIKIEFPERKRMDKNADSHCLKYSPLEGFITPVKLQKHPLNCMVLRNFAVCNRASLKSLAFAASDSSKSSIKIAYPERNGIGKTPMVIV